MAKAYNVRFCFFLALNTASALKLQNLVFHERILEPPQTKPGTGEILKSGDSLALESEVEPGMFVTLREAGEWGNPLKWRELRRITNGIMGLQKGIAPNSTKKNSIFAFTKEEGGPIVSGDDVIWKHVGQQIALLAEEQGYMWPYPLAKQDKGNLFKIEHAREVDIEKMKKFGRWGFDKDVLHDPRSGEPIKDGDSVWLKCRAQRGGLGNFLYLSSDVGEGGPVAFVHHIPGFDGRTESYNIQQWTKPNDPHATATRFTIRKISSE